MIFLLALFIAGLVVYVANYYRRSCRTTPSVENYYGFARAMSTQLTGLSAQENAAAPAAAPAAAAGTPAEAAMAGTPSMAVPPMNPGYKVAGGYIAEGGDLPGSAYMLVADAQKACDAEPKCVGFTFNSAEPEPKEPVYVYLKSISDFGSAPDWHTYFKTNPSPEAVAGMAAAADQTQVQPKSAEVATSPFQNYGGSYSAVEGFYAGPAVGAGMPDCMRSSADASKLYEMLRRKKNTTEEGPDDLRELKLILSKVSCLKRDLTGAAGMVEATRYQPFSTAHDLEPVAETAARCFAKTIPQRDLALSLNKWGSRGTFLLKRLCTSLTLTDAEEEEALALFGRVMGDITEIANGVCCNAGVGSIAGKTQPRMVGGFEPAALIGLGDYKGYY